MQNSRITINDGFYIKCENKKKKVKKKKYINEMGFGAIYTAVY